MNTSLYVLGLLVLASTSSKATPLGYCGADEEPEINLWGKPNPRIVGGEEATPHALPYDVYLEMHSDSRNWICGGALISRNYVITAAHCTTDALGIRITLGAHRIMENEEGQVRMTSTDADITIYPEWDKEELVNDLAVIRLSEPVTFNEDIQPVALPSFSDVEKDYVGVSAIVSGWGVTEGGTKTPSPVLNYIKVPIISNLECEEYFGPLEPTKICTATEEDKSVCSGDSGGPLVADGVLIGVTAFVAKDCPPGYPSGFTRITEFLQWIADNTDVQIS